MALANRLQAYVLAASLAAWSSAAAAGELRGTVARQDDGRPLAVKLFVEDADGELHVMPGEPEYKTQQWYAPNPPRFSYVQGAFAMPLPQGKYRITAMKGFGYRDWEGEVEVRARQETPIKIELEQMVLLEEDGWYCGDMHIHGTTTGPMLRAEDVNLAVHTFYSSQKPYRPKIDAEQSDRTHICCEDQEIEHWFFGNVFYFNIPTAVQDPRTENPPQTPMFFYDRQSHRMGGINLRWLRSRPFDLEGRSPGQRQPELAVSAALGYLDAWSVMDNSMQNELDDPRRTWTGDGWGRGSLYQNTYQTWYRLLNCGLRISASAGTSYGRLSRLGFNRVYVKCPDGLSLPHFADGLKRGDGFVSNGPLLWLSAEGKLPGNGLALPGPDRVKLSVRLACKYPLDLLEIVHNGRVILQKKVGALQRPLIWEETVAVEKPGWYAARCFGTHRPRYRHSAAHNLFAHTNPMVVTVAGKGPSSAEDAAVFLKEIDALIDYAPNVPEPLRAETLKVFHQARAFYAEMADR